MAITIETSTDSPEQVRTALGTTVEVEESPAEEQEEPVKPAAKPKKEVAAEPESEEDADEEESEEEAEEEDSEEEGKPKAKALSKTVPLSRLNQEIARRHAAEDRALAAERARTTPVKEEPVAPEDRPQFFSGKPEPKIEDFMTGVDEYDAKALAGANAKFTKAYGTWAREEARAEATYDVQRAQVEERMAEIRADFEERKTAFAEQEPLYDELVPNSKVMLSDQQRDFILDSEVGPHMLLYFTQYPKEATKIRQLRGRGQAAAMLELESELMETYEVKPATPGKPAAKPKPKAETSEAVPPKKSATSNAPQPPTRIKSAGPAPRTEQELAGTDQRTGVDIVFNAEYERTVKARRGT